MIRLAALGPSRIAGGRGRRGGIRVIYYWNDDEETVYMLLAYTKHEQDDLTPPQLKLLSRLVREDLK